MGVFFKNSEVKDSFKAKGLREPREALDIMRLPPDDQYSYNRYLDYLRYKASEMYSLKMEVEEYVETEIKKRTEKVMANEKTRLVKDTIAAGHDDKLIATLTKLSVEQVEKIRRNLS